MIEQSLVCFWSHATSLDTKYFVGSGFFISPERIITAKHICENCDNIKLWVRPDAQLTQAFLVNAELVAKHHDLDVAIVSIPVMPKNAVALNPCFEKQPEVAWLNGYFNGIREVPHDYKILSFDSKENHFVLRGKQPVGHSGSVLCIENKAWGITFQHYSDPNIDRGCAIALHQVWDWIIKQIPALSAVSLPVMPPSISWPEWVSDIRCKLQKNFSSFEFTNRIQLTDSLPIELYNAFKNSNHAELGENVVEAVITASKNMSARIASGEIALSIIQKHKMKDSWLKAMEEAIRLCLNPDKLPPSPSNDGCLPISVIDIEANSAASAALSTGLERSKFWKQGVDVHKVPVLIDARAYESEFETGGSKEEFREFLIKLVYFKVFPTSAISDRMDEKALKRLSAFLRSQAREKGMYLLVVNEKNFPRELYDYEELSKMLGIGMLLVHEPPAGSASHFLTDEVNLLSRVYDFIDKFNNLEWNS